MQTPTLALAFWGYSLTAIGFTGFAVQLTLGWKGGLRAALLMAAICLSAIWAGCGAYFAQTDTVLTWNIVNVFNTARLMAWFALLLAILYPRSNAKHTQPNATIPKWVIISLVLLALANLILPANPSLATSLLGRPSQWVYLPPLMLAITGLLLVEQVFRNAIPETRWAIKPLCLALAGTFGFDLYFYANAFLFNRIDFDVWSVRGIINMLVIPLIAMSSARNKDWSFNIAVSRKVVFHSTTLLASGVYLLLISGAGYYFRYFGGTWGSALEVVLLFAGVLFLIVVLLSGSLRSKLRVYVNKNFFSYRYDYREEWLRFTLALSSEELHLGIRELIINALANLVESPGGSLWLADSNGRVTQASRLNAAECLAEESLDSPLLAFVSRTQWVLDIQEIQTRPEFYEDTPLPDWLRDNRDAWLLLPLFSGRELFGFVLLAPSRAKVELNWEVLDLLKTAGRQAASYLAHMRTADALLEAKKFDSFNRMSAFVVHDVKNLVAQLSLLLKNAEKHRNNPEFQRDMYMTIDHVVERMKLLLLQLRSGAAPVEARRPVNLATVIERIRKNQPQTRPEFSVTLIDNAVVQGHPDRLERVIGHLVHNAFDATPEDGQVWVKLGRTEDKVTVEVGDTGQGMSEAFVRERLFKPFDSTKNSGMGVGAYESAQYINELGGRIHVNSKENKGTVITVQLPAFHAEVESSSANLENA